MAKKTMRIGHLKISDHLVLGIIKDKIEKGSETLNNIDIELKRYVGWNQLASALKMGEIDGAFMLAPFAMEFFYSGAKMKLVMFGHKSGSSIITNKRANIQQITDFKGKTVLIPHFLSVHNLIFDRMLREAGLDVGVGKDVVFEVVAPSQIPEAMEWDEAGSIGGFIVAEPFGSQVVKAGYGEEYALSKDIWPNHPCCVFVAQEDFVNQNEDGMFELVDSFVKSGKYIGTDISGAAAIGSNFLEQDVDVVERVLTSPMDRVTYHELFPKLDDLDTMQTYLTETISAMSGKIDLEKFVDQKFAKAANAK